MKEYKNDILENSKSLLDIIQYDLFKTINLFIEDMYRKDIAEILKYKDDDDINDIGAELIFYIRSCEKMEFELEKFKDSIYNS